MTLKLTEAEFMLLVAALHSGSCWEDSLADAYRIPDHRSNGKQPPEFHAAIAQSNRITKLRSKIFKVHDQQRKEDHNGGK